MALLTDVDLEDLGGFIDSIATDLSPAQRDIVFGYVLKHPGYNPHTATQICNKHKVQWEVAYAETLAALRAALAKRKIYKFDDLPIPEPKYERQNHYIETEVKIVDGDRVPPQVDQATLDGNHFPPMF